MHMAVDSVPAESVFLGQGGDVGPVKPSLMNLLALGVSTNGTLGLMAAKAGARSFRWCGMRIANR
jgi:hypothetical protein